jgi:hypothetical protein
MEAAGRSLRNPERIAAQVMDIGDYEDVQRLAKERGADYLRQVVAKAELGKVPPLPERSFE